MEQHTWTQRVTRGEIWMLKRLVQGQPESLHHRLRTGVEHSREGPDAPQPGLPGDRERGVRGFSGVTVAQACRANRQPTSMPSTPIFGGTGLRPVIPSRTWSSTRSIAHRP